MTFNVGQKVVYPNHGVCVVEEISKTGLDGQERQMLVHLRLLANNSKVMVPTDNLELVGLRPLCSQEEIQALFGILEDGNIDTYKDWKGRYKQNLDKMKTGQLTEVAEVLKNLCLVSQKKSLSFREKKMYERARYFIVSEVAHVRDLGEEEADQVVEEALHSSLAKLRAKLKKTEEEEAAKEEAAAAKEEAAAAKEEAAAAKEEAAAAKAEKEAESNVVQLPQKEDSTEAEAGSQKRATKSKSKSKRSSAKTSVETPEAVEAVG